jgi:hypothetical protein
MVFYDCFMVNEKFVPEIVQQGKPAIESRLIRIGLDEGKM